MKRRLLWGLVLLAGLLGLGYGLWWLISQDPGYVLLAFKGFRYQSSLWAFLALLLVTGLLGWALRRALRLLLLSLGVVNPWSRLHRGRRSVRPRRARRRSRCSTALRASRHHWRRTSSPRAPDRPTAWSTAGARWPGRPKAHRCGQVTDRPASS